MKRLRWVIRIGAALVLLAALVFVAGLTALNSESFARWALGFAAERSNGAVRLQGVSGTLSGGLQIDTANVVFDAGSVDASSVYFELDWRSLIARSVVLETLEAERVDVTLVQGEPTAAASEPIDLDMLVLIRHFGVETVIVDAYGDIWSVSDLSLDLRLLRNRLELGSASAVYEQFRVTGDFAATLAEQMDIEATTCVDGIFEQERVLGCVDAQGTPAALQLEARLQQPFLLEVAGTAEPSLGGAVDLEATWQNFALSILPDIRSSAGDMRITGTFERPRAQAEGAVEIAGESLQFETDLVAADEQIELAFLRLVRGVAEAELSGTVAQSFETAQLSIDARGVDPQEWVEQWPGSFDVRAQLVVDRTPTLRIVASDIVANGELREFPLNATGAAEYVDDSLLLQSLEIVSRADRIAVDGRIDESLDLELDLALSDVNLLLPEAHGSLEADLQISGSAARPIAQGTVNLRNVDAPGITAGDIRVTGVAGIAADDPFELALTGADLSVAETPLQSVVVGATGTAAAHRLQARVVAEQWSGSLAGSGAIAGQNWAGWLESLEFVPGDFGVWRLVEAAEVQYGVQGYSIGELCLVYTLSRICSEIAVAGTT